MLRIGPLDESPLYLSEQVVFAHHPQNTFSVHLQAIVAKQLGSQGPITPARIVCLQLLDFIPQIRIRLLSILSGHLWLE